MRDQHINSFNKGMMKDLGATVPQEGSYIDAKNIRIISDGSSDGNSGVAINIKGNIKVLTVEVEGEASDSPDGYVYVPVDDVIGYTTIRNTIIVFSTSSNVGSIHTIDTTLDSLEAIEIYSEIDLNFNPVFPIEAIGRYESEDIQRIYWTDNLNPVRTLNIKGEGLNEIPVEELSLNPPVNFGAPRIIEVNSSGELPAGMYQYAYRLKTEEGAVTRFSPLSNFVHIVKGFKYWEYIEDPENQTEYSNTVPGEQTDKAVSVKLSNLDQDYDFIELVALHRTAADSINEVYSVEEVKLTGEEAIIRHTNNLGAPLLVEEVTELTNIPSKVKTLSDKDNRLFMGGVSYSPFDLEFNARAYRYKRTDELEYPISDAELDSADESLYETYVDDIDNTEEDAINPYNSYGEDKAIPEDRYKFWKNGITLGGQGPNISYKFIKEKLRGNTESDIPDTAPYVLGEFKEVGCATSDNSNGDYKSPINAADFVGYHRDEIYRFGIVLYDLQGNPGFVNWIGDIRFPDYHDYDHEGAYNGGIYNFTLSQHGGTGSGTNYNFTTDETEGAYENMGDYYPGLAAEAYDTVQSSYHQSDSESPTYAYNHLYALGIQFNVDIPEDLIEKISGYRIVRVERTEENKTVLGSGLLNYLSSFFETDGTETAYQAFGRSPGQTNPASSFPLGYHNNAGSSVGNGSILPFLFSIDSPEWPFNKSYPSGGLGCLYVKIAGGVEGRRQDNINNSDGDEVGSSAVYSAHKLARYEEDLFSTYSLAFAGSTAQSVSKTLNIDGVSEWLNLEFYGSADSYTGIFNRAGLLSSGAPQWVGIGEETLLCATNEGPMEDGSIDLTLYLEVEGAEYFDNGIDFKKWVYTPNAMEGRSKLLASVKRELPAQYGGNTNLKRKNNTYIPAGPFINIAGDEALDAHGAHEVWGGDTYVVMYDLEKIRRHGEDIDSGTGAGDERKSVNFAFPVESSVNTTLRGGWHFANKKDWNVYTDTPLNTFELENCYSSENTTEIFIPKPLNFKETFEYDSRILYSDAKINGAAADGWRQFKLENYRDVEGGYGGITKLIVHQDNMFFLQERGFGGLSISPVSTVVDNDGTSIVLGTGDIIQNFKYLSTTVGSQDQRSIINTTKGIYWIDKKTKKIHAFRANGLDSISDTHGMKSWAYTNIQDTSVLVTGNDIINDEVLFSIDNTTLVFSEHINKFTSFYTYGTSLYINTFDRLFSVDSDSSEIYEHNISDVYNWFGEGYESSIEFIVNKHPLNVKVFDNLEWYTENTTSSKFTKAHTSTSTSGVEDGISEVVVKEGMTKMPVPRTSNYSRFRDTYMKVKLVSSNTSKFVLHYVKTFFRISHR